MEDVKRDDVMKESKAEECPVATRENKAEMIENMAGFLGTAMDVVKVQSRKLVCLCFFFS